MGTIDSEPDGGHDLLGVIRDEFARLESADRQLVDQLETDALAAAAAEPVPGAQVPVAVVEGAHRFVSTSRSAAGPTVGELSARQLISAALRPRRTTEPRT
jgi:hypothetical protein